MAASVIENNVTNFRVSSVLNKDVKQFGKKFLFDRDDNTCWNSAEGNKQWISIEFERPVLMKQLVVQFQGGFVGKELVLEAAGNDTDTLSEIAKLYPQDENKSQTFPINHTEPVIKLRILFQGSTDFFGRITIYNLDIMGDIKS